MNWAHFHLMLNHFPVILTITATVLLLWGLIRRKKSATCLSLYLFMASALIILPVYLFGENASEYLQNATGIPEDEIELHEEFAIFAFIPVLITGLLALYSIIYYAKNKKNPSWAIGGIVFFAFIANITLGITANMGGKIRHTELRNNHESVLPHQEREHDD